VTVLFADLVTGSEGKGHTTYALEGREVRIHGIGGATISFPDRAKSLWQELAVAQELTPAVVFLDVGINDLAIVPFLRKNFTPPIRQPSLPSERCLRKAHLLQEMEKLPDYRAAVLSVTGEILCIDGTKQVLKKLMGAEHEDMQFVTSVLNEWGQFLTTVVVASESEGSYRRLASGLVSRFRRAQCPAPKIIYTDNNCCR